jgi:hypothetical protein
MVADRKLSAKVEYAMALTSSFFAIGILLISLLKIKIDLSHGFCLARYSQRFPKLTPNSAPR